jgi:hypothetical protein
MTPHYHIKRGGSIGSAQRESLGNLLQGAAKP